MMKEYDKGAMIKKQRENRKIERYRQVWRMKQFDRVTMREKQVEVDNERLRQKNVARGRTSDTVITTDASVFERKRKQKEILE